MSDPNADRAEMVIRSVQEQDVTPAGIVRALIAAGLLVRASELPMGPTRLAEISDMRVAVPRGTRRRPWKPRTDAEWQLLAEVGRHSDARAELVRVVDRLQAALAQARADRSAWLPGARAPQPSTVPSDDWERRCGLARAAAERIRREAAGTGDFRRAEADGDLVVVDIDPRNLGGWHGWMHRVNADVSTATIHGIAAVCEGRFDGAPVRLRGATVGRLIGAAHRAHRRDVLSSAPRGGER